LSRTDTSDEPNLAVARSLGPFFGLPGPCRGVARLGSGHIHDTFVARYGPDASTRYVHQRLNTNVFQDPEALMANLVRVTEHVRAALARRGAPDPERSCLRLVATRTGAFHHVDEARGLWRTFRYIEGTHSLDVATSPQQAFEAARLFGGFVELLADLDPAELAETIPHFHDLDWRCAGLEAAQRDDPLGRAASVGPELEAYRLAHARLTESLAREAADPLPRRVVHNDCKLNNVLLDEASGRAVCVIDLDTVMAGTLLCDFGDLVRTATCPAPEDTRELANLRVDLGLFEALARGYVAGARPVLQQNELRLLPWAGPLLTLETGLRFLTDHVCGDVYFRVRRPDQNLDRARAQLRLLELLLEEHDAMVQHVEAAAREAGLR
jgi:hypothetical protein